MNSTEKTQFLSSINPSIYLSIAYVLDTNLMVLFSNWTAIFRPKFSKTGLGRNPSWKLWTPMSGARVSRGAFFLVWGSPTTHTRLKIDEILLDVSCLGYECAGSLQANSLDLIFFKTMIIHTAPNCSPYTMPICKHFWEWMNLMQLDYWSMGMYMKMVDQK